MDSRRIVVGIIANKQGEYLFNFRDGNTQKNPLNWALFGGGIDANESPEVAFIREMQEEIGLTCTRDMLIAHTQLEFAIPDRHRIIYPFSLSHAVEHTQITLGEGAGFAFFTVEEIRRILPVKDMSYYIMKHANFL